MIIRFFLALNRVVVVVGASAKGCGEFFFNGQFSSHLKSMAVTSDTWAIPFILFITRQKDGKMHYFSQYSLSQ